MQKRYKAALALAISGAGCVGTVPLMGNGFLWGMVHNGFLAATIGGLADWFAVTAIFRRPLGISWRTEILKRNRDRIMEAIVAFASDDLLSQENIMRALSEQPLGQMLVDYLTKRGGRQRIKEAACRTLLAAVNTMDMGAIAERLAPVLRGLLAGCPLEQLVGDGLRIVNTPRTREQMVNMALAIAKDVLATPALQQLMLANIHELRQKYEGDSAGRAFVLETLGLDDERILSLLNGELEKHLAAMLAEQAPPYAQLTDGLAAWLERLGGNEDLRDLLRQGKENQLAKLDIVGHLALWLEANIKGAQPFWLEEAEGFIDGKMDDFVHRADWQAKADELIKEFIAQEIKRHHDVVPRMIRERLADFSDEKLTEFVEERVDDDLQMIRINGSVVGSFVGMGLYAVVHLAERMWG